MSTATKPVMLNETGVRIAEALEGIAGQSGARVMSLTSTPFRDGSQVVEAIGIPVYVDSAHFQDYVAYGLAETGWYIFARIAAPTGVSVSGETSVTGAAGQIITVGADHVDVAVRFEVAAQAQAVTVDWGASAETFVFRAVDLAVRNLDYRTTFYVYDLAPFVSWEYALTTDAAFAADKYYYTESGGEYTLAEVEADRYALTEDATFSASKTYYTYDGDAYAAAAVTAGEAVPENTYYEKFSVPVPAYYKDGYVLTSDTTFQDGTTYYTEEDGVFTEASVTTGEAVTADTYYVAGKVRATGVFEAGTTYYTKDADVYTEATVTAGAPIPAYYNHSKLHIEGMARNVTYQLDTPVDCPSEIVLPAIEEDGTGAWYEMRFRHTGSFSSTLMPQDPDVKVATEHTQAETAGMNMVDLHYMSIAGTKIWRFMNTHATIPAAT